MLPKKFRLKRKAEFQRAYKKGRSIANPYFVLYYLAGEDMESTRIAFAAGKKIGNAVVRNKMKRRMREAFRKHMSHITGKGYIIFIARAKAVKISYQDVEKQMDALLNRAKLL